MTAACKSQGPHQHDDVMSDLSDEEGITQDQVGIWSGLVRHAVLCYAVLCTAPLTRIELRRLTTNSLRFLPTTWLCHHH